MTPTQRPRSKTLWVREPYLTQIREGRKQVEVRVGYDNIRRLRPGDHLLLNDQQRVIIRRVSHYPDFQTMLTHENPKQIAPDTEPEQLLPAIQEIYPPEKEALGAVALELSLARYQAVLFDMGYTLIHFEPAQTLIAQEALRAAGAERSVAEIEAAVIPIDDGPPAQFSGGYAWLVPYVQSGRLKLRATATDGDGLEDEGLGAQGRTDFHDGRAAARGRSRRRETPSSRWPATRRPPARSPRPGRYPVPPRGRRASVHR